MSYTLAEAKVLLMHAKSKGWKSVPTYFKALAKADMKNMGIVLPPNKQFTELIFALHKIGGNINQLVRYVHAARQVNKQDIIRLQCQLKLIEETFVKKLKQPQSIETMLSEFLKQYPHKRQALLMFLSRYGH